MPNYSLLLLFLLINYCTSNCIQCKLGESYWAYETNSGLSCPYGSKCSNNCYKCLSEPVLTFCSNSFLSVCPNHPVIFNKTHCKSTYIKSDSGSHSLNSPSQVLCYTEIDARLKNEEPAIIRFSFNSIPSVILIKENQKVFILVYWVEEGSLIVDLKGIKGTLHYVSSTKLEVKGNYFVVGQWSETLDNTNLHFRWGTQKNHDKKIDYMVIVVALVPSFIICLCIILLFSYYRNKKSARSQRTSYQIIIKSEVLDESFVEAYFPSKYYLLKEDEVCPICFEYFSLGDEVRHTTCNHSFHIICFDNWILSKPSHYVCPICKSDLFESTAINDE